MIRESMIYKLKDGEIAINKSKNKLFTVSDERLHCSECGRLVNAVKMTKVFPTNLLTDVMMERFRLMCPDCSRTLVAFYDLRTIFKSHNPSRNLSNILDRYIYHIIEGGLWDI